METTQINLKTSIKYKLNKSIMKIRNKVLSDFTLGLNHPYKTGLKVGDAHAL